MEFKIITISELTKNKGLEYAIQAVEGLAVQYDIVGVGEEKYKLPSNVKLLGFIENAARLLSQYDLFLLPSVKEGLPYVLLEAGKAGLPIIASNIGGIPDIIEHEKTGFLVPPKNPEAIRLAIADLINNPEKRKFLGESLKQKIERDFSLPQMLAKTIGLYRT